MQQQTPINSTDTNSEPQNIIMPHHKRSGGVTTYIAVGLVILLVGAGGFFAGTQFAGKTATADNTTPGERNTMRGGNMMGRTGAIGTVTAITSDSITITPNAQPGPDQTQSSDTGTTASKTFKITTSTKVTDDGTATTVGDIKTGDTVMIRTSSSDTTTATSIRVNPTMGGGMSNSNAPGSTQSDESTADTSADPASDGSST